MIPNCSVCGCQVRQHRREDGIYYYCSVNAAHFGYMTSDSKITEMFAYFPKHYSFFYTQNYITIVVKEHNTKNRNLSFKADPSKFLLPKDKLIEKIESLVLIG